MQGKVTVIHVDGTRTVEEYSAAKPLKLEKLQELVGGWIEPIPAFDKFEGQPAIVYSNEEAKLGTKPLPFNEAATKLWKQAVRKIGIKDWEDYLSGDIVIVTGDKEFMDSQ